MAQQRRNAGGSRTGAPAPDATNPETTPAETGPAETGPEATGPAETAPEAPETAAGEVATAEVETETDAAVEAPPEDALLNGKSPDWEDALPLIALMAGGQTSEQEIAAALKVWELLSAEAVGPTAKLLAAQLEEQGVEIEGREVDRILIRWANAGIAQSAANENGIRRWKRAVSPRTAFILAAAYKDTGSRPGGARSAAAAVSAPARASANVRPGTYAEWLDGYIHENPDVMFNPGDEDTFQRGYGTVHGAFKTLEKAGRAKQVGVSPIRFQAA